MEAYHTAEVAGGLLARAYRLWSSIDWNSRYLLDLGHPVAALSKPETDLLERAARGAVVEEVELTRTRRKTRHPSLFSGPEAPAAAAFRLRDAMGRAPRERHHRRCNRTDGVPHATAE
jgi:hypothetical protein